MELFHLSDVALEPIDARDDLELAMRAREEFYIPPSAKGIVKLINADNVEKYKISIGDTVYFDPRMMIEIPELKLVVVDIKAILLKIEKE
jgi:hypothetical protein